SSDNSATLFNSTRETVLIRYLNDNPLTYDKLKQKIRNLTGIMPIIHDMCPNSCLAYTGPFSDQTTCMCCGESHLYPTTREAETTVLHYSDWTSY
ncbi:hypothetical protein L208DRAFT_1520324, partial [Tricholoma matsutake]